MERFPTATMIKKSLSSSVPEFSRETARAAFAAALTPDMERLRQLLIRMAEQPPQVLLLEGGNTDTREALARYWAALMLCPHVSRTGPCLECSVCLRLGALVHSDFQAYDGRISNREDEENPGPVRACSIRNIRELKSRLGDAPHEGEKRIVQFARLERSRDGAANALLKVLEEPSPYTLFVLLTPQREQLLPTLVSRSWVLTLPWCDTRHVDADLVPWLDSLADFLTYGRGWLEKTATKGTVDAALAERLISACGKALRAALEQKPDSPLSRQLVTFSPAALATVAGLLAHAHEELVYMVTPPRVLDNLAVQLYCLRNPEQC